MSRIEEEMSRVIEQLKVDMVNKAFFGAGPGYASFVQTGSLKPSTGRKPSGFAPRIPLGINIVQSEYLVESKMFCRERKRSFWKRLWDSLWDVDYPWPYSPVEFYKQDVPSTSIIYDDRNKVLYCHPAMYEQVKREANQITGVR